jgi:hypothetical protein
MIAVAAVAVVMALPIEWSVTVGTFGLVGLLFAAAARVEDRGFRRIAAGVFWVPAILINILYAMACLAPVVMLNLMLLTVWFFVFAPVMGRFGVSWGLLATREAAAPRRSPRMVWSAVIGLTVLPALTVMTLWPLRLGFLVARPTLERLADQAAAGNLVTLPAPAGPFRVLRASVEPESGQVGLMTEPNPSRPTGFVRARSNPPPDARRPIFGTELDVELGWGWSYREDD